MAKVAYISKKFKRNSLELIDTSNAIIEEYFRQGYDLTLRQLYYQLVARGTVANEQRQYKRLSSIITDARLAGLVDWSAIVDRTRRLAGVTHWRSPSHILEGAIQGYALDKWLFQPERVEVWCEKDALSSVVARACGPLDVDYFSCRGYVSASAMYRAAARARRHQDLGQNTTILHLGDHDPSGMDMTRDIEDRLVMLSRRMVGVVRIALNMDQIRALNPPPNPTKLTDSRAAGYVANFGYDSWELDALDPTYLNDLITDEVLGYRNEDQWIEAKEEEEKHIDCLKGLLRDESTLEITEWRMMGD